MKYYKSAVSLLCLIVILHCTESLIGQTTEIDSLKRYIQNTPHDSSRVDALIELSSAYFNFDLELALNEAENAVEIANSSSYLRGVGFGLKNIGIVHYYQGDYVEAVTTWQEALDVFELIDDKEGVANMLSNIGVIYATEGDYSKALEYYLRSLKVAEATYDTLRIITTLGNIGAAYADRDATQQQGFEYSLRALNLAKAVKNPSARIVEVEANAAVNIAGYYLSKRETEKALDYFNKALETMEDPDGRIFVKISISKVYRQENKLDTAYAILEEALAMAQELNLVQNEAFALKEMAKTYQSMGLTDEAIGYFTEAALIFNEIGALKELEYTYKWLHQLYSEKEDYKLSYAYLTEYMVVRDSIYDEETEKLINNQMFDFQIQKKQDEINLKNKDLEIAELDIRKQKVINGLVGAGMLSVAVFLFIALSQKKRISKEKQRSENLLLNILPYEVAEELKENGESEAKHYDLATVLFTDFKGFTGLSQTVTPTELVEVLNFYFKGFDHIITRYKIEKIKTIGDAYMAVGGLPVPQDDSLKNVIMAGLEMQELVKKTQAEGKNPHARKFSMRLGIHTGPVVAGIVGVKKFQYDIWGDTVNTAARMESSGEIGRVNISGDTYETC